MPEPTLDAQQKRALAAALLACPSMADRARRDAIIRELPAEIQHNITRSDVGLLDVTNSINTVLNYPGGLQTLLDLVRLFEGDSLAMRALDQMVEGLARAQPRPPSLVIGSAGRADFYAHISLPPNYVPRPELIAEVRRALLADTEPLALTSTIKIDALHGMGGLGKSVMARALCDEPQVQAAFPDGILWAELGKDADEAQLRRRLNDWIGALGGIVSETAPSLERLKTLLAGLLQERACLLILDDAWDKRHVEWFRVAAPRCRLLLTTRDAAMVADLGGRVHGIPLMAEAEAVRLLEQWAGDGLRGADPDLKAGIVRRVGYLPLAIQLAGAQLQHKDPRQWLATFDATRLAGRRPQTAHDSLAATFGMSLGDLSPADRAAYAALAIFRQDEPLLSAAAVRLWMGLDGRSPEDGTALLDDLAARGLVQGGGPAATAGERVVIHALLRDFMAGELGPQGRYAAHRALLAAYHASCQGPGWHTAPDDGYLYDHLAYHLNELARNDPAADAELAGLFATQGWLHARVPQSVYLYDGYLADLAVAWSRVYEAANGEIDAGQEPNGLASGLRYALIRSSINSLAANYPPELVARAVEQGAWTPTRGLSVARRVPEPKQRSATYAALLELAVLSPAQRAEAAGQGLVAAQAISDEGARANALAALAPHLSGDLLAGALATAQIIGHPGYRVRALAGLAPHLTGDLLAQTLEQGLAATRAIEHGWFRASALAALAPHLADERRTQALEEVVATALTYQPGWFRAALLVALVPHLSRDLLVEALTAALATSHPESRASALASLAPYLTDDLRAQALAAAQILDDEESRALALAALAPHLTGERRREALEQGLAAAQAIVHGWSRAGALAALVPYLGDTLQAQVLEQGLAAAQASGPEWYRPRALAALAPHLTGNLLSQALAAALTIEDEEYRAEALAGLTPHLTGDLLARALAQGLAAALTIANEQSRARALAALAPHLTGDLLAEALAQGLAAALAIDDEGRRAEALAGFASRLSGTQRAEARAAARAISDERYRTWALTALTPHLNAILAAEGLAAARAIKLPEFRAKALASLASHLTGDLLDDALWVAQAPGGERFQADALAALAPHLTDDLLLHALTDAEAISHPEFRANALAALAPHLTGDLRARARTVAEKVELEPHRARALAALMREEEDVSQTLSSIRRVMLDHLYNPLAQQRRSEVLVFCGDQELFRPPILSPATLAQIARHVIEICQEWEWL